MAIKNTIQTAKNTVSEKVAAMAPRLRGRVKGVLLMLFLAGMAAELGGCGLPGGGGQPSALAPSPAAADYANMSPSMTPIGVTSTATPTSDSKSNVILLSPTPSGQILATPMSSETVAPKVEVTQTREIISLSFREIFEEYEKLAKEGKGGFVIPSESFAPEASPIGALKDIANQFLMRVLGQTLTHKLQREATFDDIYPLYRAFLDNPGVVGVHINGPILMGMNDWRKVRIVNLPGGAVLADPDHAYPLGDTKFPEGKTGLVFILGAHVKESAMNSSIINRIGGNTGIVTFAWYQNENNEKRDVALFVIPFQSRYVNTDGDVAINIPPTKIQLVILDSDEYQQYLKAARKIINSPEARTGVVKDLSVKMHLPSSVVDTAIELLLAEEVKLDN